MCEFCKIIRKETPAHIVYENEKVIAFLDYAPIHEGHTLILPKEHVDSIDKMKPELLTEILRVAREVVQALRELYGMEGYTMMQNGGKFCDFGHAHFHVFPRYEGDGFGWIDPQGESEYSARVAEQIREKLAKGN